MYNILSTYTFALYLDPQYVLYNKKRKGFKMKQLKLIVLLMLVLSLALASFASCDRTNDSGVCNHSEKTAIGAKNATCTSAGYTGDEICNSCDVLINFGTEIAALGHDFADGVCTRCGVGDGTVRIPDSWKEKQTITIAEALELCDQFVSSPSTDRYYIIATVKSVDDTAFGKLMIEDETGEIMVYGTNSSDGSLKYDKMGIELKAGDFILIYGTLQNYKGTTKEIQNAWLIDHVAGTSSAPTIDVKPGDTITIDKALSIAGKVGANDRFYITATVKTITNAAYGAMIISDETGEISVYNSANSDGSLNYSAMTDKPYKGDTVLLYCTLQNFNGNKEISSAYIVEFTHNTPDINPDDYALSTISDARAVAADEIVKVSGVVARITYANGYKPSGFMLIDNTSSIYVYDGDLAARVAEGNTITIVGTKDYWILDTEQSSASKFGYKGCNQLTDAILVDNDNGNSEFDTSWITAATVKEIMDTPASTDITTLIFKTTALVKRVDGNGFINYYIDDIDGHTGSYVYTQCNGGDFEWLDKFDGKFCTVYLVAINAKSSASGCVWRFIPVKVVDEGYTFNTNDTANYAVTYHGMPQFLNKYTGDPAIILETLVSSELLGFEGATLSYASSDESVVYFTNEDDVITFHCGEAGSAVVTVTGSYNGITYSETIEITVAENVEIDHITVAEAIATPYDTNVVVKGIVGPSLVNKTGFYLFGEDGSMIAVLVPEAAFDTIAIGNEIIISGMRERYIKNDSYTSYGQDAIVNCEILANYYGEHAYSTEKFITGKTLADIKALNITESHSTEVYIVKAKIEFIETAYYTSLKITYNGVELQLYCSGAGQYNWLKAYSGQEVTLEIAPCNWNDKQDNYRGCVLAVVLEDGTKVLNTLNFN